MRRPHDLVRTCCWLPVETFMLKREGCFGAIIGRADRDHENAVEVIAMPFRNQRRIATMGS